MVDLVVPHPDSVLSDQLRNYNETLYLHLAEQESYTYTDSQGGWGVDEYQPLWRELDAAWLGYLTQVRVSADEIEDFYLGFYGFWVCHVGYGSGSAQDYADSDAYQIFDANGMIGETLSRPVDWFDDYIPPPITLPGQDPPTIGNNSPHMDADILQLGTASIGDKSKFDRLYKTVYIQTVRKHCVRAVSVDIGVPSVTLTKPLFWDTFFIEKNWKAWLEATGNPWSIPPRMPDPTPAPEPIPPPEPEQEQRLPPSLDGRLRP